MVPAKNPKQDVSQSEKLFNPFMPNVPFLYPLKVSENRKVIWCFQRVEKGCIGNKWGKIILFWCNFIQKY